MARYVCTEPCWHGKRRWAKGDIAEFEEGEYPKNKKGNLAHFELIEPRGPGRPKKSEVPKVDSPPVGIRVLVNEQERTVTP